jgi:hypothetical protein
MSVTGPAWLLVLGFTGHGLKDLGRSAATMWPILDGGPVLPRGRLGRRCDPVVLIAAGAEFQH